MGVRVADGGDLGESELTHVRYKYGGRTGFERTPLLPPPPGILPRRRDPCLDLDRSRQAVGVAVLLLILVVAFVVFKLMRVKQEVAEILAFEKGRGGRGHFRERFGWGIIGDGSDLRHLCESTTEYTMCTQSSKPQS